MPFIAGYIRVFDLWTRFWEEGGEKATARPTRQRQRQRLSYTHPGVGIADLTVFIEVFTIFTTENSKANSQKGNKKYPLAENLTI